MRNGRPLHMAPPGEKGTRAIPLEDWAFGPESELATRRHQVFALLGWYHKNYVLPNRGLKGMLRRVWLRIRGQERRILSPWEAIELHNRAEQERAAVTAAEPQVAQVEIDD